MVRRSKEVDSIIDTFGIERCKDSCERVKAMLKNRPWVSGEIIETPKDSFEDELGIDMFVPVEESLAELMCLRQDPRGLKFQIKSKLDKENSFRHHNHEQDIFNLATGENIFVLNGQEKESLMLATLIGQIVAMSSLTGSVPENEMLNFLAVDMVDEEAVLAYIEHREYLIRKKWFRRWLTGFKIKKWKEPILEILASESW